MDNTLDTHIHLRTSSTNRDLIDQAAALRGENRSQFMLSATLREARNTMLDRADIVFDDASFNTLLDQLDKGEIGDAQKMKALLARPRSWSGPSGT